MVGGGWQAQGLTGPDGWLGEEVGWSESGEGGNDRTAKLYSTWQGSHCLRKGPETTLRPASSGGKAETHPTNRSLRNVGEKARSGMIKVISAQVLSSFLELLTSVVKLHYSCIPQFLLLNWLVSGSDIGHKSQTQGFGSTSAWYERDPLRRQHYFIEDKNGSELDWACMQCKHSVRNFL